MKIGYRKWNFFSVKKFFFVNSDFKNGCKNEFQDNNEKSCSWLKNKVPQKFDFRAAGTQESHPTAWKLKVEAKIRESDLFLQGIKKSGDRIQDFQD